MKRVLSFNWGVAAAISVVSCSSHQDRPPASGASVSVKDPYAMILDAAHCWSGPAWVSGASSPKAEALSRCRAVLTTLGRPEEGLSALRAVSVGIVTVMRGAIDSSKHVDRVPIARLLGAIVTMHREALHFRRAVRRIKAAPNDENVVRSAAAKLAPGRGVDALLRGDFGKYSADARVVGLLGVLTRLAGSRELQPQLRIRAVADPLRSAFGVAAPRLGANAAQLQPGVFVRFIARVAEAAGAKLPAAGMLAPARRLNLAFAATLGAIGRRMRDELGRASPAGRAALAPMVGAVTERLARR
ncbi:MAG: hypothetical protein KC503_28075 [Myxococcales bacterium]|nr:hypothetical protein [Myxococcales bacterium]